jgi:hypothetical protein
MTTIKGKALPDDYGDGDDDDYEEEALAVTTAAGSRTIASRSR